jgi:hypothetical protein
MPLPFLLAGMAAGGGAAAATGGAAAGGGLLFGTAAAGGAAATSGLFGAGGSFALPQTMMTAGMGMGLAQAFGGSSQGSAPTTKITLSPEGKKLEKNLYSKVREQYETGLMPENLASIYVGKIKRKEAQTHKQARGFLTSMQGKSGGDVRALLTEGGRRREGLTEPTRWRMAQKAEEFRNALRSMETMRNIERQTPLLRAQAAMYKSLQSKGRKAAQGQALGDLAIWSALSKSYG